MRISFQLLLWLEELLDLGTVGPVVLDFGDSRWR